MATEQELAAVLALRKDEIVGGESSCAILAKEYGGSVEHLPTSELRALADQIMGRPAVRAAFLKPVATTPVNPIAEAIARAQSHASPVGYGIDQAGAHAPLPRPPFAEYQPVDKNAPEPIDLNARSMVGHLQTINAAAASGIGPTGRAR